MAFKYAERVQELSTSTGTGDLVLSGAPDSTYQTFASVFSNGDTTDVAIFGAGGFECCRATYNSGANSITRGTRYASSNGGAAANFGVGTKTIVVSAPGALIDDLVASYADLLRATNNLSDLTNTATARTNLGLVIGTNVEAWSANLDTFAALGNWKVAYTNGSGNPVALTVGAAGTALCGNGVTSAPSWQTVALAANNLSDLTNAGTARTNLGLSNANGANITLVIDGGGAVITTGVHGDFRVPCDCTLTGVTAMADQSGSIQIDVWKDTYAHFPPDDTDSITASAPIVISSSTKSEDTTLTGWTKTFSQGDILRFNVDSVSTIKLVTLELRVTKS